MKRILPLLAAALLATACHRNSAPAPTGLDEFAHDAPAASDTAVLAPDTMAAVLPPVTSQGVGPVRLGMAPDAVPRTLAGVYDSIEVSHDQWEGDNYVAMSFYLRGQKTLEALAIADAGRIDAITVLAGALTLGIDGTSVGIGTPSKRLARMKGVHSLDDAGATFDWHGVTIYTDADTVSAFAIGN